MNSDWTLHNIPAVLTVDLSLSILPDGTISAQILYLPPEVIDVSNRPYVSYHQHDFDPIINVLPDKRPSSRPCILPETHHWAAWRLVWPWMDALSMMCGTYLRNRLSTFLFSPISGVASWCLSCTSPWGRFECARIFNPIEISTSK